MPKPRLLRKTHTILAYLFFLMFLAHFGAIMFHTLIVREITAATNERTLQVDGGVVRSTV
jgi:uncharacterized membrane protein